MWMNYAWIFISLQHEKKRYVMVRKRDNYVMYKKFAHVLTFEKYKWIMLEFLLFYSTKKKYVMVRKRDNYEMVYICIGNGEYMR